MVEITEELLKTLDFSMNTMCNVESILGVGIFTVLTNRQFTLTFFRGCIWGSLYEYDKSVTLSDVGNGIDQYIKSGGKFERVVEIVLDRLIEYDWFENVNKTQVEGETTGKN